jgi:hypothetical protein
MTLLHIALQVGFAKGCRSDRCRRTENLLKNRRDHAKLRRPSGFIEHHPLRGSSQDDCRNPYASGFGKDPDQSYGAANELKKGPS